MKKRNKQRDDIQGLRAIAIIAVLLFHIWPDSFRNGYAGVDIFFVISGYLMAMILSQKHINKDTVMEFYMRRIHRIMPSYILTLFIVILIGTYLLTEENFQELIEQSIYAVLLVSNMRFLKNNEDYFEQVESYNFLLHTWSLAVEMQYYLIVPLIFYILDNIRRKAYAFSMLIIKLICSLSLYIITYFLFESFSFNFTLCREWQFLGGTISYFYGSFNEENIFVKKYASKAKLISGNEDTLLTDQNNNDSSYKKLIKSHSYSTFIMICFYCILLSCILNLEELPKLVVRIISTTITAIILAYHNLNTSKIFNNKILSYIGDISYILYLFHWPIIQFVRYYMPMVNNDQLLTHLKLSHEGINVLCFALSFGIAIIVHHLFEKRLLNLKMMKESIMITTSLQIFYLILALNVFYFQNSHQNNNNYMTLNMTNSGQIIKDLFSSNRKQIIKSLTREKILKLNNYLGTRFNFKSKEYGCEQNEAIFSLKYLIHKPDLSICETKSTGNLTIFVAGNSHAIYGFPAIKSAFHGNYKFIKLYSIAYCLPFDIYDKGKCKFSYDIVKKIVSDLKPDILILFFKYSDEMKIRRAFDTKYASNDKIINKIQQSLNFFSNLTKAILFNGPNLYSSVDVRPELIRRLKLRLNTNSLNEPLERYLKKNEYVFKRLNAITCEKCTIIDLQKIFCDEKLCYNYDKETTLAYFLDTLGHLTVYGRYKLYASIEAYIKHVVDKIS